MKNVLFFFLLLFSSLLHSQTLDNTFGEDGIMELPHDNLNATAIAVVEQADGKIVTIGNTNDDTDEYDSVMVVRTHADGSLDQSFSSDGIAYLSLTEYDTKGLDVKLDADGKIIIAGQYLRSSNRWVDLFVARLNADGTFDNAFGEDGIKTLTTAYPMLLPTGFVLQPDGKILITGMAGNDFDDFNSFVARLTSSGELDNAFDNDGMLVLDHSLYFGFSINIVADDKILLVGNEAYWSDSKIMLVRLEANGALDNTFGTDGKQLLSLSTPTKAYRALILPDEKVLIVGSYGANIEDVHALVLQVNADGSLDESFGTDGIVQREYSTESDELYTLSLTSDNKIVVGGYSYDATSEFLIDRLNADGTVDVGFTTIREAYDSDYATLTDLLIDKDGKILAVGSLDDNISPTETKTIFAMVRYETITSSTRSSALLLESLRTAPNPVIDRCTLSYSLHNNETLSIFVQNAQGVLVKKIVENSAQTIGDYSYSFSLSDLAPGVYTLKLEGHDLDHAIKIVKQ